MKWASAISRSPRLDAALADVVEQAARGLDQIEPDLVFLFLSANFAPDAKRIAARLAPWLGSALLVGCSAQGVAGGGRETEGEPAIALLAGVLPDVDIEARHVTQDLLRMPVADAAGWRALLGVDLDDPAFVVIADPHSVPVEALVKGLDVAHPGATKVGGIASGGQQPGSHVLLLGTDVYRAGAIVLALGGNVRLDAIVAQGCKPVGEPHFVTSCHEHLLRELDGASPRDVLTRLYENLSPADRQLFGHAVFVGLALPGEHRELHAGDFLVRNLLGLDPDTGALWIGGELQPNSILQFHLRDAATSAADLDRQLQRFVARGGGASGALMFSCVGRGAGLYGRPDHDTLAFQRHLGEVPLGGFFGNGEIGPVAMGNRAPATYVHGHTSAFGVFRPKRPVAPRATREES
jgi:small ligand-binding sensory domain FIST